MYAIGSLLSFLTFFIIDEIYEKSFCQRVGWNNLLRRFESSVLPIDKQVFSYISSMEETGATFFANLLFFKVVLNLKRIANSIA